METAEKQESPLSWIQLESVIPLKAWGASPGDATTVESVTSLSPDTVERLYSKYIVQLSARRVGMKLRHALQIAAGELKPSTP